MKLSQTIDALLSSGFLLCFVSLFVARLFVNL
jgi:hypothetical protein